MATYVLTDLNGREWDFSSTCPLGLQSIKGIDGAEFGLEELHGVGQRGVTVVGSDFKAGQIQMVVKVEPWKIGLEGQDAVEILSAWRDGIGEGEVRRGDNEMSLTVIDAGGAGRFQAIRLTKKGPADWEKVQHAGFFRDELTFQSDESDWRAPPITSTFTAAQFAGAKVANHGTVDSWPWFRLTGPITSPTLGIAGEAVNLPTLAAGKTLTIETDPNWYQVTDQDGVDKTFSLYILADGADDRWRNQAPARNTDIPVTATGTGTTGATKLEVVVPQIYRSAL
ncbi:hypothetical protein [Gordonia sp. NB41Y]|uniref:hypothetical protein n=1 Tax=Gordonia sp. NB41Y TaxID=875808 RepID=UPI0002C024DF|nr:hypothetical protein [Gordonia sp. NB41Y]EMP10053.1 hypothetical protein ISGA_380 [Gordonia sp. NB41Y]WLP90262.1 hypothetical protein Q9K23_22555 [Gordonia sp. NB41Y]